MALTIKLVPKAGNRLEPEGGRAEVKTGQTVVFTVPGGSGGQVTFAGRSPFSSGVIKYDTEVKVERTAASNAADNVFKYSCRAMINGQPFSTDSGGEIEIIRT